MRKINFRVWDNLKKAYLNEEDIAIDNQGNIFIFERYDKNDSDLWYTRLLPDSDNKRYVIEQSTGLKDGNGTKINEGDTSDFEPIFESEYGGWIVYFDYENRMLDCAKVFSCDRGELVHYATKEDAERSIKENRADWLAYFGIKEWE